jgi:hypothetical protein
MGLLNLRQQILEWVFVPFSRLYGMFGIILSLTNYVSRLFAGYPFNCPLDPYVVLSPAGGAAPRHGYWVQPFGDGSTGYLQPIRVAF